MKTQKEPKEKENKKIDKLDNDNKIIDQEKNYHQV